ncbi:xanthine dehydrogenase family protein molybdopterin-binding subunit [Duganella radicis]|uniref:Molybdopterin-dependent oxidoreductase n=1 Tax=Duganella radicis TaxID=551988 RepID=A0A6L6PKI3_9BURK|nr:molybdopterin cofactor-binding domain-containing protein [Duganella radicis]MTV39580.1 molybdopterin-dependent oxidoreductase [Duganella radicis]
MGRIEGPAKSQGKRIFTSDFGPSGIWATTLAPLDAILVCSRTLEHDINAWDSTQLPQAVRPSLAFQPVKDTKAEFNGPPLFASVGETPDFFGQPIAIAFYEDSETAFFANQYLRELSQFQGKYQPDDQLRRRFSLDDDMEAWRQLKLPQASTGAISYLKTPGKRPAFDSGQAGFKTRNVGDPPTPRFSDNIEAEEAAWDVYHEVRQALKPATGKDPNLYVHKSTTMLGDNAFLEPESGLAWYESAKKTLHLQLGSQNIYTDIGNAGAAIAAYRKSLGLGEKDKIEVQAKNHDIGGGFGGRNGSLFVYYLALAAVYAKDRPVRLRWDRFQQFLLGLKRHSSVVQSTLRVAPESAQFLALEAYYVLGAGIHANLSGPIVALGALHLTGPYNIPKTSLHGMASLRPHTPCGPSRGFGIPQACLHIETLVDRVAHQLNIDPLELRMRNLFKKGDLDPAGYPLNFHVANQETLERARAHDVWLNRNARQLEMRERGLAYGVGFAANMEAYGASSDPVFGAVQLTRDGRVMMYSDAAEMGQGSRTSLALIVETLLGIRPEMEDIRLAETGVFETPFPNRLVHSSSTASRTAFIHQHPIREACAMLMQYGFLPAAQALLGLAALPAEYHWEGGALHIPGEAPIARATLLDMIREKKLWSGVMCHAAFQNGWRKSSAILNQTKTRLFLDGLAIQSTFDEVWEAQLVVPEDPSKSAPQRSLYAAAGHLVEITVDRASGRLTVLSCHSILDAGDIISKEIVEGQAEGGFAMGLGFALSEQIPDDPRDADFMNFHTYRAPRFKNVAPVRHTLELIPLPAGVSILSDDQPKARSKGIAEAVMTTVAPALANAIAHASGNYQWLGELQLPLTRKFILTAFEDHT